jgi:hypothetical protein
MRLIGSSLLAAVTMCLGSLATRAIAAPAPTFTVSATNVTLPAGATSATSQITVTSVNGYAGQIAITCQYSGSEMNAKAPTCGGGPQRVYTLTANQSTQGALSFYPYGTAVPAAAQNPPLAQTRIALALVLFGACFFLSLRRRTRSILVLLFAAIFLAGFTSCGANGLSGTFPYTITGTDFKTNSTANTSITVTVP